MTGHMSLPDPASQHAIKGRACTRGLVRSIHPLPSASDVLPDSGQYAVRVLLYNSSCCCRFGALPVISSRAHCSLA